MKGYLYVDIELHDIILEMESKRISSCTLDLLLRGDLKSNYILNLSHMPNCASWSNWLGMTLLRATLKDSPSTVGMSKTGVVFVTCSVISSIDRFMYSEYIPKHIGHPHSQGSCWRNHFPRLLPHGNANSYVRQKLHAVILISGIYCYSWWKWRNVLGFVQRECWSGIPSSWMTSTCLRQNQK